MTTPQSIRADDAPLATYAYSYPHKSSYRALTPPVPIERAWRDEDRSRLFLYVHVPFCEMRCGFCNLFTQSRPGSDVVESYLNALERQMNIVRASLPDARFVQLAIGGGTPTFLSPRQIERVLSTIEKTLGCSVQAAPTSVETSPETADEGRLRVLADYGVERVSLGVQSFIDDETRHIGRPQRTDRVRAALDCIRRLSFRTLNIDLIYGAPEQTRNSWTASLQEALRYRPEEIYLYPLYVRPETGLGRTGRSPAPHRVDLYRLARDLLLAEGYHQVSLRCFRLSRSDPAPAVLYTCQRDGMVGLGCGARSYTRGLHYATRFAVTQAGIRVILRDWIAQSDEELAHATHGIRLSDDEQRRRFVILSLLQADGLDRADYTERFGSGPLSDLPELARLVERGWLDAAADRLVLTSDGLENSDYLGPLLYSAEVRARLEEFVRR